MPKQKRDYSKLKLEFFESDIDEVKPFFEQRYNQNTANNKQLASNTKGRAKEKQEYKRKLVEKALEEQAKKDAKELIVPVSDMMKGKKAMIQLLLYQVSNFVKDSKENKDIDEARIERIMRMIKTELGEPTNINKNMNENKEISEDLSDEELEALDLLFKNVGQKKKH